MAESDMCERLKELEFDYYGLVVEIPDEEIKNKILEELPGWISEDVAMIVAWSHDDLVDYKADSIEEHCGCMTKYLGSDIIYELADEIVDEMLSNGSIIELRLCNEITVYITW